MSQRGEHYEERAIRSMPEKEQRQMAHLVLLRYKFSCGELTLAGNRWWNVKRPDGKHLMAHGGLNILDVVRRVQATHEKERIRLEKRERDLGLPA